MFVEMSRLLRFFFVGRRFRRVSCFFFQAEDGIRDLVRSRGLGDVYKRQGVCLRTPGGARVHWGRVSTPLAAPAWPWGVALDLSLIHI